MSLTLFSCMEGVVPGGILDVEHEGGVGQDDLVIIDLVDGVLEGKFRRRVSLVFREDGTWGRKEKNVQVSQLSIS